MVVVIVPFDREMVSLYQNCARVLIRPSESSCMLDTEVLPTNTRLMFVPPEFAMISVSGLFAASDMPHGSDPARSPFGSKLLLAFCQTSITPALMLDKN